MVKKPEDKLERFIIEHRNELDSMSPPDELWEDISFELKNKKRKVRKLGRLEWVWRVAAVFFFGLTVYLVADKIVSSDSESVLSEAAMGEAYINFLNAETYYSDIIQVKKNELDISLPREDPLNEDFSKDISELDSTYILLKKEYEINNDEVVMDAMIYNLRLRIEMLDKQLYVIENLNKIETNKNEGISI